MRRVEIAKNVFVVDYEAGIGGEGYVQPNRPNQDTKGHIIGGAKLEDGELAVVKTVESGDPMQQVKDFIIDDASLAAHRRWVESRGWSPMSTDGESATIAGFMSGPAAVQCEVAELPTYIVPS